MGGLVRRPLGSGLGHLQLQAEYADLRRRRQTDISIAVNETIQDGGRNAGIAADPVMSQPRLRNGVS
jgi:hypothetical protein